MHSAFNLRQYWGLYETQLNGSRKHSEQWAWLYTRDIIIIDKISMLTSGALHGVNHALNNVNVNVMSCHSPSPPARRTTSTQAQLPLAPRLSHIVE